MINITRLISTFLLLLAFSVHGHEFKVPQSLDELTSNKIIDNVYVIHGMQAMPAKSNEGFMSNSGFVVSDDGVVIIDTGGSYKYGQFLIQKIREVTDKPVVAVFNTHMHGDHWLGNSAIREAYPGVKIYAHEKAIKQLKAGEANLWMDIFGQALGKEIAGTHAVIPDSAVKDGETIILAGSEYHIHHKARAHTDNDIMIEYAGGRILFAGDVVVFGSVPSGGRPQDFNAKGTIKMLEHALSLPVEIFIPGHGPTGDIKIPQATKRFMDTLYSSVQRYYEEGLQDFEMRDNIVEELAEFSDWRGMDEIGRIISFVYQEVEAAEFQ